MISFIVSFVLLVAGYFVYGSFVERVFGVDPERKTPCFTHTDGSDFIPMPTWKVYTIQFLNIAGTGPIFGALMGVLYGPAAFLWIVFGCLLGGAMHDYMSGMISIRRDGASLPEIIGDELGSTCRLVMRIVTLVLMVCVGASFVMIPAGLMDQLTVQLVGVSGTELIWTVLIFAFYLAVTIFSIDKIVGNVYPIFGVALLLMAVLVCAGMFIHPAQIPGFETAFADHYPVEGSTPLFPGLFITIACGAVSGFHATQSPMMARCIKNEKYGLRCFYGAMVTEGVVALIWAAAAIVYVGNIDISGIALADGFSADLSTPYGKMYCIMTNGGTVKMNPALLVNMLCNDWLGTGGLVLAVLGIVAAPMSTGGSAFRAARLICADFTGYGQSTVVRRIIMAIPLFLVAILMLNVSSFKVLWLYVSWFNQVLATFTFFTIAHYLKNRSHGHSWLIAFFPAVFMLSVSSAFILIDADNGFGMNVEMGYIISAVITVVFTALFLWHSRKILVLVTALVATGAVCTACGDDDSKKDCPCNYETDYVGKMGIVIGNQYDCGQIDASLTVYQDNKHTCNITLHPFWLNVEQMRNVKMGLLEDLEAENIKLTVDETCGYRFEGSFKQEVMTLFGDEKRKTVLSGTMSGHFGDGKCSCTIVFPPQGWEGMSMEMRYTFTGNI